jgi:hypothetical protein
MVTFQPSNLFTVKIPPKKVSKFMDFKILQAEDNLLGPIMKFLQTGEVPELSRDLVIIFCRLAKKHVIMDNGCLYLDQPELPRVGIPIRPIMVPTIAIPYVINGLKRAHCLGNIHFSKDIVQNFYYEDINYDLLEIFGDCKKCVGQTDFTCLLATEPDYNPGEKLNAQLVAKETGKDPLFIKLLDLTIRGWVVTGADVSPELKPFYNRREHLSVINGVLLYKNRIIVPPSLRKILLNQVHWAHFGEVKTLALAKQHVFWPGLKADIENTVKACIICQEYARNPPKTAISPSPNPKGPWQRLHADYAGPFLGGMWLVIMDSFSKYPHVLFTQSTSAEATVSLFKTVLAIHGLPLEIVTDNGPQFSSVTFNSFCAENGIKHLTSPPYSPKCNGLAENFVGIFKNAMLKARQDGATIKNSINDFLINYRATPHTTTGEAPSTLLFKRRNRTQLDLLYPSTNQKLEKKVEQMKTHYNAHARNITFKPGEAIWFKRISGPKAPWQSGTVTEQLSHSTYKIKLTDMPETKTAHADQLRTRKELPGRPVNAIGTSAFSGDSVKFLTTILTILVLFSSGNAQNILPGPKNNSDPVIRCPEPFFSKTYAVLILIAIGLFCYIFIKSIQIIVDLAYQTTGQRVLVAFLCLSSHCAAADYIRCDSTPPALTIMLTISTMCPILILLYTFAKLIKVFLRHHRQDVHHQEASPRTHYYEIPLEHPRLPPPRRASSCLYKSAPNLV